MVGDIDNLVLVNLGLQSFFPSMSFNCSKDLMDPKDVEDDDELTRVLGTALVENNVLGWSVQNLEQLNI